MEKQTHIRVYERDKKILDFIMRRRNIRSQAQAFRKLLRVSLSRNRRSRGRKQ